MKCAECKNEIIEIGFECETFAVCKSCDEGIEADWKNFQVEMADHIKHAHEHGTICKVLAGEIELPNEFIR